MVRLSVLLLGSAGVDKSWSGRQQKATGMVRALCRGCGSVWCVSGRWVLSLREWQRERREEEGGLVQPHRLAAVGLSPPTLAPLFACPLDHTTDALTPYPHSCTTSTGRSFVNAATSWTRYIFPAPLLFDRLSSTRAAAGSSKQLGHTKYLPPPTPHALTTMALSFYGTSSFFFPFFSSSFSFLSSPFSNPSPPVLCPLLPNRCQGEGRSAG